MEGERHSPTRRESTLLIAVPEAEPLVAGWRASYDPSAAAGVPAHITILYPFLDADDIHQGVVDDLHELLRHERPFPFTLAATKRFEPPVLYLEPRPSQPFIRLITELWSRYPDHPPYGGRYRHVLPHLTIGEGPHGLQYDAIEHQLRARLPIEAVAQRVTLMEQETPGGRWRTRAELPLGGSGRR